jgi:hypothetical protein
MAMSNDLQPFHGGHQRRHRRFGDRIFGLPPWMSGTLRALAVVLLKDPIRQRSALADRGKGLPVVPKVRSA